MIQQAEYAIFVSQMADVGDEKVKERLQLFKACVGLTAEYREFLETLAFPFNPENTISEAGDVCFWITEIKTQLSALDFPIIPCIKDSFHEFDTFDFLDLSEKVIRHPDLNPSKYYDRFLNMLALFIDEFNGLCRAYLLIDEDQSYEVLAQSNFDKLTARWNK